MSVGHPVHSSAKRKESAGRKKFQKPISSARTNVTAWLAVLYFFSGIPALLYQTVWQRLLVLHSGVGSTSVSIIVAAYMLGLGLGSLIGGLISGSMHRRRSPRDLLLAFAIFEMAIAAYAYFSPTLFYDLLYRRFGGLYDDLWSASALHFATLVLPTTMMGMTLPLLTSALAQMESLPPRGISLIYGTNALGAATGALITPWILLPFVGVDGVCSIGAAINFMVAIVAIWLCKRARLASAPAPVSNLANVASRVKETSVRPIPFAAWAVIYFTSGFIAIGLEIIWFRLLDVSVKSSAYTFGTLLAVFLGCLALGSLFGSWRVHRINDPLTAYLKMQSVVIVAAMVPIVLLVYTPEWILQKSWLFEYWAGSNPLHPSYEQAGGTLVLYLVLPLMVMGVSTFAMGASFAALQRGVQLQSSDAGLRVGLLQAANIVGCVLGSLLVGLWWLGSFGTPTSLRIVASLEALLAGLGLFFSTERQAFAMRIAIIVVLICCMPGGDTVWLRIHGEPSNSEMVVVEDVSGIATAAPEKDSTNWRVSANGKSQSSLPFGGFHAKLGALPATLHSQPESIAIIGLGSGNTAWAAACRQESKSITVFEVCTAEMPLLENLASTGRHPQLKAFLEDQRVEIVGNDARHSLMTTDQQYDIIETDAIRPQSAFAGYLYSLEFFELCRSRLKPGGLMCCWSPTSGTYSTFRQAFPHVLALDSGFLLIGSTDPIQLDVTRWKSTIQSSHVAAYLGPEIVQESLVSVENVSTSAEQFTVPMINTDLFPYDEFHVR